MQDWLWKLDPMQIKIWSSSLLLSVFIATGCTKEETQHPEPPPAAPSKPPGLVRWSSWGSRDSTSVGELPSLLYLYSRRSYWSQQMAHQCFSDSLLAKEIERGTFPIAIDVDRRPDLAERYGMGSWPSVFFLTPDGQPITAAGFMESDDFTRLLRRVRIYFDDEKRKQDLDRERGYLQSRLKDREKRRKELDWNSSVFLQVALDSVRSASVRHVYPGAEGLILLLEYGYGDDQQDLTLLASRMLNRQMGRQPDEKGLGYFLSPLTPDGLIRDRERNVAVNAQVLRVLSRLSVRLVTGKFAEMAENLAEELVAGYLDATDSLLVAGYVGSPDHQISPARDTTYFASWNALAVSGFLELHRVRKDGKYLALARSLMRAILKKMRDKEGLILHIPEQTLEVPKFLEDQALVARATLDLYDATGEWEYLRLATELASLIVDRFQTASGALRDRSPESGAAHYPVVDRLVPSGIGVAIQVFSRLDTHRSGEGYAEQAEAVLNSLPMPERLGFCGALIRGVSLLTRKSATGTELTN